MKTGSLMGRMGAHPLSLWTIKHLVSPIDRMVVRLSRGRVRPLTGLVVPTLLVTVTGRRTGRARLVPLVYVRDGDRYVVGNARPSGERTNPWVLNLRDTGEAEVHVDGRDIRVAVTELGRSDLERLWPGLVKIWPALDEFFAATGDRAMFSLQPID